MQCEPYTFSFILNSTWTIFFDGDLPDPNGSSQPDLARALILASLQSRINASAFCRRKRGLGKNNSYTAEERAKFAEDPILLGNQNAADKWSALLRKTISESTVCSWKKNMRNSLGIMVLSLPLRLRNRVAQYYFQQNLRRK